MTAKLRAKDDVVAEPVDTVARCVKFLVPDNLCHTLEELYPKALEAAREMLKHRELHSSADWPGLKCVVSKSLIAKYQRNLKCKEISHLVIPICGDKGKQVKLVSGGIRVYALFKDAVIPAEFPWPVIGFIRGVEFFKRDGRWFMTVCVNTPCEKPTEVAGVVGVDRNSKGNVAVMADIQTGKVLKLGVDPAGTKKCFRGRRANLQSDGKFKLLEKTKRKQSRRMTFENHKASRTIVDYAAEHRCAIALEDLSGVRKKGSKIKHSIEKNQWAFYQLGLFLKYKAALRGVPIVYVDPAYTSQACSRCGKIQKANGKRYECSACRHKEHRDANAAFNIGRLGAEVVRASGSGSLSVLPLGSIGGPYAGKACA
jgi:putative transposase